MTTYVRSDGIYFPDGTLQTSASVNAIKGSIQTGFYASSLVYGGGTEDYYYADITISAVNTSKSNIYFQFRIEYWDGYSLYPCSVRFISSTVIRISSGYNISSQVRWYVVESN